MEVLTCLVSVMKKQKIDVIKKLKPWAKTTERERLKFQGSVRNWSKISFLNFKQNFKIEFDGAYGKSSRCNGGILVIDGQIGKIAFFLGFL